MKKYRVLVNGEPEDEIYDTYDEAEDAALYLRSCSSEGAEILFLSNPGDYEEEEDEIEIEEFEE